MITPVSPASAASGIEGIAGLGQPGSADDAAPGFAGKVTDALSAVSAAEADADAKVRDVAAGGDTPIHELMVASTKATLSVEMLVQLRNRAVEAYQEVMRMQV